MSYYYDIILNWNEKKAYDFYEWDELDCLEVIKKIPIFKVKHQTLIDLISNKVKVNSEFLMLIKDKTLINSGKKLDYASIFTDGKNVIALEFNSGGLSISQSKLLLEDELNLLETTYNLKEYMLDYLVIEQVTDLKETRQELEAKRIITLEINSLYQTGDVAKLRYLYYEYKKIDSEDIKLIYESILDDLKNEFTENILNLAYIIKKSYHNV